jgi:hypothetical protein
MADMLETLDHLGTWAQAMGRDKATVIADPFATMVLERATELVAEAASLPALWPTDPTLVPGRCRTITLLVAARTYTNPRSIITEGTGPLTESMLAKMAAAMELTPDEKEELEAIAAENGGDYGGLWVIQTTVGPESRIPMTYLPTIPATDDWVNYGDNGQTDAFVPLEP